MNMGRQLSTCTRSVWDSAFLLSFLFLATLFFFSTIISNCNVNWHYQHVISRDGAHFINQELVGCRPPSSMGHLSKFLTTGILHDTSEQTQGHELVSKGMSQIESLPQESFDSCAGRRIYMYNLPPAFNALLLQQCEYKIAYWINFCPHILNHGFGKAVNYSANSPNDSNDIWADWYETDFYMLEIIFHSRMAIYPCRTQSARDADAFFIPYYSALDALGYLFGDKIEERSEQGKELIRWLMQNNGGEYWRRRGGHDHFIVMGRTAWDFTRSPLISRSTTVDKTKGEAWDAAWGTSFASLPEMENVTTLFLERRPWGLFEQAIPYPTGFHPISLHSLRAWQDKVRAAKRTFLMAFVGAPRPPVSSMSELRRIRQMVIHQCMKNTTACTLIDCRIMQCATEPVQIAKRMLDAQFCLQPPGDTSTRRSTFDGLISGCIPVFFTNESAYTQYTWHFPPHEEVHPSSYSVLVPRMEIRRLVPLLSSFSTEHIVRKRKFIMDHLIPQLIYAHPKLATSHPTVKDAFQLTVDNMLSRVAKRAHT